jgi:hypothetical protein
MSTHQSLGVTLALSCLLFVGSAKAEARASGAIAAGGGQFTIGGVIDVQFSFTALETGGDGAARGKAHHATTLAGQRIEFYTDVTCLSVDATEGRAWIGGVILRNESTHPSFTGEIHQPGRDIWFRVVDYGEGAIAEQQDRATFVGFEGGAGIITSQEYCDTMPWPDGDDRTNPVTEGNVQVLD